MGGSPGRLITPFDKKEAINLLEEACNAGARKFQACEILDFSVRTHQRWLRKNNLQDGRSNSNRIPTNKLTEAEKNKIIEISTLPEYRDLAVAQIVPRLADQGYYVASESSFYRVLKEHNLNTYRGKSKPKTIRVKPELVAMQPNSIWSWDITFLQTLVKGVFYYLYLIMDVYSRKIVGFDIFEEQLAEHSAVVITEACKVEGINELTPA